jgi:hypothetical protein
MKSRNPQAEALIGRRVDPRGSLREEVRGGAGEAEGAPMVVCTTATVTAGRIGTESGGPPWHASKTTGNTLFTCLSSSPTLTRRLLVSYGELPPGLRLS